MIIKTESGTTYYVDDKEWLVKRVPSDNANTFHCDYAYMPLSVKPEPIVGERCIFEVYHPINYMYSTTVTEIIFDNEEPVG